MACAIAGYAQPASAPGVYCIAIGVGNNGGESLAQAPKAARRFADAVNLILPSSVAHTTLLIDGPGTPAPSPARIRQLLASEISQIPRYSTVFFYYAGHGEIRETDSEQRDLKFVLSGQRTADVRRENGLGLIDLMVALGQKKMVNGLVVLDCCHSGVAVDPGGAAPGLFQAFERDRTSARFAYLVATSSDQETIVGEFTDELIEAWRGISADDTCTTPDNLVAQVERLAAERDQVAGTRNRRLLKSPPPIWCLSSAGQPQLMVLLVPTKDFSGAPSLWYGGRFRGRVAFDQAAMFPVMLPKTTTELRLDYEGTKLIYRLKPAERAQDVIVLRTDGKTIANLYDLPPDKLALSQASLLQAEDFILSQAGVTTDTVLAADRLMTALLDTGYESGAGGVSDRFVAAFNSNRAQLSAVLLGGNAFNLSSPRSVALLGNVPKPDVISLESYAVTGSLIPSTLDQATPYRILAEQELMAGGFWDLQRALADANTLSGVSATGRPTPGVVQLDGMLMPGDGAHNLALLPAVAAYRVEHTGLGEPTSESGSALTGVTNVLLSHSVRHQLLARSGDLGNRADLFGAAGWQSQGQSFQAFGSGSHAEDLDSATAGLSYFLEPWASTQLRVSAFGGRSERGAERYRVWLLQASAQHGWDNDMWLDVQGQIGGANLRQASLSLRETSRMLRVQAQLPGFDNWAGHVQSTVTGTARTEEGWRPLAGAVRWMESAGLEVKIPITRPSMELPWIDGTSLSPLLLIEHRPSLGNLALRAMRGTWSTWNEQLALTATLGKVGLDDRDWRTCGFNIALAPKSWRWLELGVGWKDAAVPSINAPTEASPMSHWLLLEESGWTAKLSTQWRTDALGKFQFRGTMGTYETSRLDASSFLREHRQVANASVEWRVDHWLGTAGWSLFNANGITTPQGHHSLGNAELNYWFRWGPCTCTVRLGMNDINDDHAADISQLVSGLRVGRDTYLSFQITF